MACEQADAAIRNWRAGLGTEKTLQLCALLSERLSDVRTFSRNRPILVEAAWQCLVGNRATCVLGSMSLSDVQSQGLGTALKRQLAAHSIHGAADLTREALGRVPGLGRRRIAALPLWRNCVSLQVENAVSRTDETARTFLRRETERLDAHAAILAQAISRLRQTLEAHVEAVANSAARFDPDVATLISKRDQIRCDLAYLKV